MALKYAIEDLSSDLAYISQITTGITKQVKSIKKKAENAVAAGYTDSTAKLDDAFFLSRELFDLDPSYIDYACGYPTYASSDLDSSVQVLKDLYGYPFDSASASSYPTAIGPYHRNWPIVYSNNPAVPTYTVHYDYSANVDLVTLPLPNPLIPGSATLVLNDKVLLRGQTALSENGVYLVTAVAPDLVLTRYSAADISYATILSGLSGSKCWWNWGSVSGPKYVEMTEYNAPLASTPSDNLLIYRSHKIYGLVYHTEVASVETNANTLETQMKNFVDHVNLLREATNIADTISRSTTVISDKLSIDNTLLTLKTKIFNIERIGIYFHPWIPVDDQFWSTADRQNQLKAGFISKPHKPINAPVSYNQLEKTYNNNFTKALGDGSGGSAPGGPSMTGNAPADSRANRQIANNHNSIIEYWSQIGWMAAERANNYKAYIELLEHDLETKGLEEILEMHDKAVNDTYEREKDLGDGFLQPYSPKPLAKSRRYKPDLSLPYTDAELRAIGLLPPLLD